MPTDSDVITISIPDGEIAPYDTPYGTVSLFRKPATPDPFVNSVLTSLGEDADGNERFWISCVNNLCGATSFLIDEAGRSRVFRWPNDGGSRAIYAIVPEDRQTIRLAGGATEHLIRLDLTTGLWETFPRTHGLGILQTQIRNAGRCRREV